MHRIASLLSERQRYQSSTSAHQIVQDYKDDREESCTMCIESVAIRIRFLICLSGGRLTDDLEKATFTWAGSRVARARTIEIVLKYRFD